MPLNISNLRVKNSLPLDQILSACRRANGISLSEFKSRHGLPKACWTKQRICSDLRARLAQSHGVILGIEARPNVYCRWLQRFIEMRMRIADQRDSIPDPYFCGSKNLKRCCRWFRSNCGRRMTRERESCSLYHLRPVERKKFKAMTRGLCYKRYELRARTISTYWTMKISRAGCH